MKNKLSIILLLHSSLLITSHSSHKKKTSVKSIRSKKIHRPKITPYISVPQETLNNINKEKKVVFEKAYESSLNSSNTNQAKAKQDAIQVAKSFYQKLYKQAYNNQKHLINPIDVINYMITSRGKSSKHPKSSNIDTNFKEDSESLFPYNNDDYQSPITEQYPIFFENNEDNKDLSK